MFGVRWWSMALSWRAFKSFRIVLKHTTSQLTIVSFTTVIWLHLKSLFSILFYSMFLLCFKFDFKIIGQQKYTSTTVSWVLHPRITTYIRQHKWRRYMTFCSSPIYISPPVHFLLVTWKNRYVPIVSLETFKIVPVAFNILIVELNHFVFPTRHCTIVQYHNVMRWK